MSVLFVLHEASRTGAPRVGGLIAAALQQHFDVRVLCLSDGPLIDWIRERVGPTRVSLLDYQNSRHQIPFAERVRAARAAIEAKPCELVYVNSVAASEFVVAAKSAGIVTVLHVHEKAQALRRILEIDLAKLEILALCDGVVLAAGELRKDLVEVFGFVPERHFDFGIAVDAREIEDLAGDTDAAVYNAIGRPNRWGDRLTIGMCGYASRRKGSDIFFEVAPPLPEHDFVWVGDWSRDEAPENIVFDEYSTRKLPNLYVTGGVDNPYKYIGRFDLFFLSSREDPNPLVLTEALLLGVPVFCFSRTTAVTDFLGRSAILCHGAVNTPDSVRVLRALDAAEIRSDAFRGLTAAYRDHFDVSKKIGGLVEFLSSL